MKKAKGILMGKKKKRGPEWRNISTMSKISVYSSTACKSDGCKLPLRAHTQTWHTVLCAAILFLTLLTLWKEHSVHIVTVIFSFAPHPPFPLGTSPGVVDVD